MPSPGIELTVSEPPTDSMRSGTHTIKGAVGLYRHAEALFQQALIRRELGQQQQAAADLERLVALPALPPEQAQRGQYWRARLLEGLDQPGAQAALARVAAEHPTSYYGLLARSRSVLPLPTLLLRLFLEFAKPGSRLPRPVGAGRD